MNYERYTAIGNATKDAQLRKAAEGDREFTTFTLAVNKTPEITSFFEVVIFDATAHAAAEKIKKGDPVLVDGTLNLRPYKTKKGEPMVQVQVRVDQWRRL